MTNDGRSLPDATLPGLPRAARPSGAGVLPIAEGGDTRHASGSKLYTRLSQRGAEDNELLSQYISARAAQN